MRICYDVIDVLCVLLLSRKVACSIPWRVIGILHLLYPSGRTMALGSSQPLTEMIARFLAWGVKAAGADCLDNLPKP